MMANPREKPAAGHSRPAIGLDPGRLRCEHLFPFKTCSPPALGTSAFACHLRRRVVVLLGDEAHVAVPALRTLIVNLESHDRHDLTAVHHDWFLLRNPDVGDAPGLSCYPAVTM